MTLTRFIVLVLAAVSVCKCSVPDRWNRLKTFTEDAESKIVKRLEEFQYHLGNTYTTVNTIIESQEKDIQETIKLLISSAQKAGINVTVCTKKSMEISEIVTKAIKNMGAYYDDTFDQADDIVDEGFYHLYTVRCKSQICVLEFEKNVTEVVHETFKGLNRITSTTFTYPAKILERLYSDLDNIVQECIHKI